MNIFNFWVLKCYNNIFTKEVIISNICSIIILGIIFINLIGLIIFCLKDHSILYKKIMIVIKLSFNNEENLQVSKSIIIDSGENKNDIITCENDTINNKSKIEAEYKSRK